MPPPVPPGRPPLPRAAIDKVAHPLQRFLRIESASGVVLLICAIVAMTAANVPALAGPFHEFWETHLRIGIGPPGGPLQLDLSLHHWVNDALMTLFFFVVGLEIKRELVAGELSTARKAILPVIAAAGGMVVPAGIYLALQYGEPGERGWGIPMATDIAFVVGVLAVFGPRVPFGLKVFLLALAIVDDIGAILVIALVYSGSPEWVALAVAAGGFVLTYGLNRLGVRTVGIYLIVGAGIWLAVLQSGIHPTIAGVLLGLLTPASAWIGQTTLREAIADVLMRVSEENDYEAEDADYRRLEFAARESLSPLHRLEYLLHPWVGFVIMPLFALANAGVAIQIGAVTDPISLAVAAGLILGKPIGIVGFSYIAVKLGLAALPTAVNWRMMVAAGCLGGIGFTMSLFIAGLALDPTHLDAGKLGIMIGSLVSVILGSAILGLSVRGRQRELLARPQAVDKLG